MFTPAKNSHRSLANQRKEWHARWCALVDKSAAEGRETAEKQIGFPSVIACPRNFGGEVIELIEHENDGQDKLVIQRMAFNG